MSMKLKTGIVPAMLLFLICLVPVPSLASETIVYNQIFESDDGGFTTDGAPLWGWDSPLNPVAPLKANSSTKCWGTTQGGTALGTLEANLYSPVITLPQLASGQEARVSFSAYIDVNYEEYGEGDFYISTDQMQTWQLLARFYERMTETGWQRYSFNISEYSGQNINLRFRAYVQDFDPGFYIDDVIVIVEDMPGPAKLLTLEASEATNPKASCPWVYTWDGSNFIKDNDIYSVGRYPTGEMRDYYLLQKPLVAEGGLYNIEIHEVESEDSWTDQVGLWAIDHQPGVEIAPDNKGNIVAYETAKLVPPVQALDNRGNDVLERIHSKDNRGLAAYSGDYLNLDFGQVVVEEGSRLVLRVKGFNQGTGEEKPFIGPPAIVVQILDANSVWLEIGRLNPRFEWSQGAFDLSAYLPDHEGEVKIRLRSISHGSIYHEIDFAGLSAGAQPLVHKNELALRSAHLGNEDVAGLLGKSDNQYVPLTSGNKFSASFGALPLEPEMVRDFILLSEGYYIPKASTFFIFTWDGAEWLQRESYSFGATDSQRLFNLSSYLPDPQGEYKVRIWQDYANWPAAVDFIGLQVNAETAILTSATDLRKTASIFAEVQASDDTRLEYPLAPDSHLPRNRWSEYKWVLPVTVTFIAGANGSLTGEATQAVSPGTTLSTVTAVPQTGYHFLNWTGSNGFASTTSNPLIISNATSNQTITANFAITFTVTVTSGSGGSLTPSGTVIGNYNERISISVTPESGNLAELGGTCGGALAGSIYTTNPITADCTITALFNRLTHTVTATAEGNGTITPATQVVADGATATFTITPREGYRIEAVTGCQGTLSGNIYTTAPITGDCNISVAFSVVPPASYAVTVSTDLNGTVSCTSPVNAGANTACAITPSAGYALSTFTDNGINVLAAINSNAYAIASINSDHSITAIFAPIQPPVQKTADLNNDGLIDLADALRALKIAVGIIPATPADISGGDLAPVVFGVSQPDGMIDISDVLIILKKVLDHF